MHKNLRLLIAEDSKDDTRLLMRALQRDGWVLYAQQVDNRHDARQALEKHIWDVVITDHAMPSFSSEDMLQLVQTLTPETPCIVVSGAIGEETVATLLRTGAVDYINKNSLKRLAPAVQRAVREVAERQSRHEAEEALRQAHAELEQRVQQRTAELLAVNTQLQQEIQVRQQMEVAQAHLAAIVQSSSDAILSKTLEGRITSWNTAAEQLYGYTEAEVLGQYVSIIIPAERRDEMMMILARIKQGGALRNFETLRVHKDGRRIDVSLTVSPVKDNSGTIIGASSIAHDISERKQLERDLAEAWRKLAEIREQERLMFARELHDHAVQQLLGLNYQLERLKRQVEGVARDPEAGRVFGGELDQCRQEILNISRGLRARINELRPAGLEELGLHAALSSYFSSLEKLYGPNLPELKVQVPKRLEALPQPVAVCLFRAAQEAVRNALHHASAKHVELRVSVNKKEARLLVKDDGQGFEVPAQLSSLVRENHFGLVGLQEQVAALNGRLVVHSGLGKGTEVVVYVPLQQGQSSRAIRS